MFNSTVFPQNIFVSYDTDHIEEDEDGTPNGEEHTQRGGGGWN